MNILRSSLVLLLSLGTMNEAFITSTADMELLLPTQAQILKNLEKYVNKEKKRMSYLEKYWNRLKSEYAKAMEDAEYYLGNPINAFTIVKRLSYDLEFVEEMLQDNTGYVRNETLNYPTESDLKGAMHGLIRLQMVYLLNVTKLADGIIRGHFNESRKIYEESTSPMTTNDLYTIGKYMYESQDYFRAIDWLTEAWRRHQEEECEYCPSTDVDILDLLSQANFFVRDIKKSSEWIRKRIQINPTDRDTMEHHSFLDYLETKVDEDTKPLERQNQLKFPYCQGKQNVSSIIKHSLRCFYARGPNRFLYLAPIKTENLHFAPFVLMFHDVISDEEIQTIKQLAKPKLWENIVNETENAARAYRNSEAVRLEENEVTERVSRRISHFTGLSMKNSEPLKVVHYGVGGMYENHFDCNSRTKTPIKFFLDHGDRIATIMFYLTDVAQGGATIFPGLGLSVYPKKGAALYWMNLLPSGDGDDSILHGACPVLRGSKYVAIKWPHEYAQKLCPIWYTPKGIMTEQMYNDFSQHEKVKATSVKTQ